MKKQDASAMNIVWRDISELTPYERNAKLHPDEQIDRIANSLEAFGWQQTLVIDSNGVIIVGHGRLLAAQKLTKQGKKKKYHWNNNEPFDWNKVPCKLADTMTEDEIKAYRLADNKLNESPWDEALKEIELADIEMDMEQFGFEIEQAFENIHIVPPLSGHGGPGSLLYFYHISIYLSMLYIELPKIICYSML